jgi:oligosaccharide repeat unit polymerase
MVNQRNPGIWWLHPAAVFSVAGVAIGIAAYLVPESMYRSYWRTPKFFELPALELTLFCVAVFVFGSFCGSKLQIDHKRAESSDWAANIPWNVVFALFRWSFYLCVLGYAIWAALAIQRGMTISVITGVLTGEKGAMYDARFIYLPTVGGVTTLTQFGSAAMIFGAVIRGRYGWSPIWRKCGFLFLLAVVRALMNSERFAIIEMVVPFAVATLAVSYSRLQRAGRAVQTLIRLAPVIGVVALFCLFTGFEYFRSWTNYYAGRDLSLLEFGAMRLLGYYVTSFNNGAYFMDRLEALNAPYFTMHFLWLFPLSGPLVKRFFPNPLLDSSEKWFYFPFLEADANVEFNNADGILYPLMDFGVPGGLLYWFVIGVMIGAVYHLFRRREPLGLFLYPMLYLGLIEIPLGLYWGEGRAFPPFCFLIAGAALIHIMRNRYSCLTEPVSKSELAAQTS